ncbi:M14 family metallopeptidase [Aliikangiella maris]|uniref:M14-type cytosolic carboxypeptidase n=2 Tax=Aliikangiella maris TaxID=3162458 RepID=A0ABV2BP82_9GAMM
MQINSQFDGGNIDCINSEHPADIQLNIRKDNQSEFYQWFYFRVTGARDTQCCFKILNAKDSAYEKGWHDYQAVASYDQDYWFRVPTEYVNGQLQISHTPESDSIYYAYFAPYSLERCAELVNWALEDHRVSLNVLGQTLDGRDLDQLIIGEPASHKKKIWIHARQHPGETMASWWMEGFLQRLLDATDPIARAVLNQAVFYVVPNMNPDGSYRGHLRTNAAGANLNREWLTPTMEKSPEVYLLREQMEKLGVDFCLDVHGDEALPYNFAVAAEGVPDWNEKYAQNYHQFCQSLLAVSPDFQTSHGYPKDSPGTADLTICTNYIVQHLQAPAIILEMPFKDTVETPEPVQGWSAERSSRLGAACLNAIADIVKAL